jgi:large subunit ribosomal protein L27Ae
VNLEKIPWKAPPEKGDYDDPIIDLTNLGYHKLTGKGKKLKHRIAIKARLFSAKAEKKVALAGGVCVLSA